MIRKPPEPENFNLPKLFRNLVGKLFGSKADLIKGKRLGTNQRKSRAKSKAGKLSSAVARRRAHTRMTKQLQRNRRQHGRNQHTG
jgi:hypothetical protein